MDNKENLDDEYFPSWTDRTCFMCKYYLNRFCRLKDIIVGPSFFACISYSPDEEEINE